MAEELKVEIRDIRGKRRNRRLRETGVIPAVLYGHKEEVIALSVPEAAIGHAVRAGHQLVNLSGAVKNMALIREVQWDTWGDEILHVDFARVDADERVEVEVAIELRGEAPGMKDGGVVEQPVHSVSIECGVTAIPEKLELNINELVLNQTLTAAQLPVPEGAKLLCDDDLVIVQCVIPMALPEGEGEEGAGPIEPEVIGGKPEVD